MSGSDAPAIEMADVSVCYNAMDERSALQHIDLLVESGEFLGVIGPNGGGKTTLLRLVTGLLAPRSGTIRVLGTTPSRARARVGYLAQHNQHDPAFPITVREVVGMGRLNAGSRSWLPSRRHSADESVELALRTARLDQLAHTRFGHLSGGQQQRVLLARALVGAPDLLVLDEPTTGLDPASVGELHRLLERLHGRVTVLMVSHATDDVADLATRIITVDRQVRFWSSQIAGTVATHA